MEPIGKAKKARRRQIQRRPRVSRGPVAQLRPATRADFRKAFAQTDLWASARVPEAEVPHFFAEVLGHLNRQNHQALLRQHARWVAALQQALSRFDWHRVDALTLAVLLDACIAIRRGVHQFLSPTPEWPTKAREYLYTHFWILRAKECGVDPHEPMRMIALLALAGPLALEEISRRIGEHPGGIAAGLLPLAMEDELPNVIPELLRTVRKTAWKHIPRPLQRRQYELELDSAILRTVFDRLRHLDPLDACLRALDGAADILPKAGAEQLQRDVVGTAAEQRRRAWARPPQRAAPRFEFVASDAGVSPDPGAPDPLKTAQMRQIEVRSAANPRLRAAAAVVLGGASRKETASAHNVDVRTLHRWIQDLKKLVRELT